MDLGISAGLALALTTLTTASGIIISDNESFYDLCYNYYNYINNLRGESWEGLNEKFDNQVTYDSLGQMVISSEIYTSIKEFLEFAFEGANANVSTTLRTAYQIPSLYQCVEKIYLDMDTLIITFPLAYFKFTFVSSGSNEIIEFGFYRNSDDALIKSTTGTGLKGNVFSGELDFETFLGWHYPTGDKVTVWLGNALGLRTREITFGYNSTANTVIDFPLEGEYNPNFDDGKTNDDGSISVPVIPPSDLIGGGVDVWSPDVTVTPGDTITWPETDAPSIDITGEIDIPTDTPTDTPIDTPIDTTIPGIDVIPSIPPIIPEEIPDGSDLPEGEDGTVGDNENDDWGNSRGGGLYYYYIGDDTGDSLNDDVIGHATGVVSLSYTPYLWFNDCNITKIPYDSERFGRPSNFSNFYVYRINEVTKPVKKVGGFTAYKTSFSVNTGEGQPYNYMNETKLYQYPYSFAYVYDGINQPLEIKYHYLQHVFNDVYIKQTVSDKCTYGLFVKDYKGDTEGNLEGIVLTSGNELPCSSSAYAQWFATNRNQMNQNIQNVLATNAIQSHGAKQQFDIQKDSATVNMLGGLATALGSAFAMNLGGVGSGLVSAFNTTNVLKSQQATLNTQLSLNKQSDQNAIQSAMALNNDMRNAPPTLISHGSNVFYGLLNNNRQLLLLRMGLNEEDYYRIGTYFTMYGYKQNKIMDINLRSRKYFNYFKITAPNIVSPVVPHAQIEKIKEIFKEGITLWHYNNSNKILDYFHSDNYEV